MLETLNANLQVPPPPAPPLPAFFPVVKIKGLVMVLEGFAVNATDVLVLVHKIVKSNFNMDSVWLVLGSLKDNLVPEFSKQNLVDMLKKLQSLFGIIFIKWLGCCCKGKLMAHGIYSPTVPSINQKGIRV